MSTRDGDTRTRKRPSTADEPSPQDTGDPGDLLRVTLFTNRGGPLIKHIWLEGGKLRKDGSACVMTCGAAETVDVCNAQELADLIKSIKDNQALALGVHKDGRTKFEIVTKDDERLNGDPRPDIVARTKTNIVFRPEQPAWALLDFDTKGMPTEVQAVNFWESLVSIVPELATVERVERLSTKHGSTFRLVFKVVTAAWMARSSASASVKVWWAR